MDESISSSYVKFDSTRVFAQRSEAYIFEHGPCEAAYGVALRGAFERNEEAGLART